MEVQDILRLRTGNPILQLENSTYSVSPDLIEHLEQDFLAGLPFVYLLSESEFYGQKFYINSNVLIPRPETEQMVDLIANSGKKFERVLDVGTGSGVILLSLINQDIALTGIGVDLSPLALEVACINRERLKLQNRCEFILSDRLSSVDETFDLIVSNPPYIKEIGHRSLVHQSVDRYEPPLALFLPDAEYEIWFTEFFMSVKNKLKSHGVFMMEGHENELQDQAQTLKSMGFVQVEVLQDYTKRDRFLRAIAI